MFLLLIVWLLASAALRGFVVVVRLFDLRTFLLLWILWAFVWGVALHTFVLLLVCCLDLLVLDYCNNFDCLYCCVRICFRVGRLCIVYDDSGVCGRLCDLVFGFVFELRFV